MLRSRNCLWKDKQRRQGQGESRGGGHPMGTVLRIIGIAAGDMIPEATNDRKQEAEEMHQKEDPEETEVAIQDLA